MSQVLLSVLNMVTCLRGSTSFHSWFAKEGTEAHEVKGLAQSHIANVVEPGFRLKHLGSIIYALNYYTTWPLIFLMKNFF